jgi:hypothetical protein
MIHGKRPITPIVCRPRKSPGWQVRGGYMPTAAVHWRLTDQNLEKCFEASVFDASKFFTILCTQAMKIGVPPDCDLT